MQCAAVSSYIHTQQMAPTCHDLNGRSCTRACSLTRWSAPKRSKPLFIIFGAIIFDNSWHPVVAHDGTCTQYTHSYAKYTKYTYKCHARCMSLLLETLSLRLNFRRSWFCMTPLPLTPDWQVGATEGPEGTTASHNLASLLVQAQGHRQPRLWLFLTLDGACLPWLPVLNTLGQLQIETAVPLRIALRPALVA